MSKKERRGKGPPNGGPNRHKAGLALIGAGAGFGLLGLISGEITLLTSATSELQYRDLAVAVPAGSFILGGLLSTYGVITLWGKGRRQDFGGYIKDAKELFIEYWRGLTERQRNRHETIQKLGRNWPRVDRPREEDDTLEEGEENDPEGKD